MKIAALALLAGALAISFGCSRGGDVHAAPATITPLKLEQLERLLPYMTDLRKRGDVVRRTSKSELAPGQTLVQYQNSQTYTFSVWVDADDHPVMPEANGEPVAAARRPVKTNGTFEIVCIGGCTPNTSGGDPCTIVGCDPVDNACGCTPIDCPGCLSAGCLAGGSGALAGTLILQ